LLVAESWKFDGDPATLTADAAIDQLRARIANETLESWLTSSSGRLLAVVTNTERAMVMLLNGQDDEYPNKDTVPLPEALRIVRHILTQGNPPTDAAWTVDR
jgi:hypothetical protein